MTEKTPRRTTPGEMVGETVHEQVVDGEHEGRVDRVSLGDRDLVRRGIGPWCEILSHGPLCHPTRQKERAPRGALLRWEVLLEEVLKV